MTMNSVLTQDTSEIPRDAEPHRQMQTPKQLVASLLVLPDFTAQKQFLTRHLPPKTEAEQTEIAQLLKDKSYNIMRADHEQCTAVIALIFHLADLTQNPTHKAIGLLAQANYLAIGQFKFLEAVPLYNEAAAIYRHEKLPVKEAQSQIGKIFALSRLGRNEEAFSTGEVAKKVLFEHEEWFLLANLIMNLAIVHRRLGQDSEALTLLDEARTYYEQLGEQGKTALLGLELNRGLILRHLGQFEASISAHKKAMALGQFGQIVGVAQTKQNLAMTYFVLGRYK